MDDGAFPPDIFTHESAPYRLERPAASAAATPVIFASPHSGRIYPPSMLAAAQLDACDIRRSEDAHVDMLIAAAVDHGHTVLCAQFARAYIDVNREPWELDPAMFADELPAFARARTARVAAGLGAIARIVREGQEIYARKLTFAEAEARVRSVHEPYHAALAALIAETKARFGLAVLVDWHSMPASATGGPAGDPCDVVLGDRFGSACASGLTRLVERALEAMGFMIARNAPYAGGYTTTLYGRGVAGCHALQIEISRALYLDESSLKLTQRAGRLTRNLGRFFRVLADVDWAAV